MEKVNTVKHELNVNPSFIDQFLNKSLRVYMFNKKVDPGDLLVLCENDGIDFTGRKFYAKVIHTFFLADLWIFQFELFGYMDMEGERVSISGDYPHEAKTFPSPPWAIASFDFEGTRPAWIYEGIKWHSEVSLARLSFVHESPQRPEDLVLRVQGRNGERYFAYENPKEVTTAFTAPIP